MITLNAANTSSALGAIVRQCARWEEVRRFFAAGGDTSMRPYSEGGRRSVAQTLAAVLCESLPDDADIEVHWHMGYAVEAWLVACTDAELRGLFHDPELTDAHLRAIWTYVATHVAPTT